MGRLGLLDPLRHTEPAVEVHQPQKKSMPGMQVIIVSYGDRTLRKTGFSEDGTFGPGCGRILTGKASASVRRPADGRLEGRF